MPSKEEKLKRRAIVKDLRTQQIAALRADIPISESDTRRLLDFVNEGLATNGCDHTLRAARTFLQERGLPQEAVIQWLNHHGGYCDCEIAANVQATYAEILI
jgi:hypothetical protein